MMSNYNYCNAVHNLERIAKITATDSKSYSRVKITTSKNTKVVKIVAQEKYRAKNTADDVLN